MTTKIEAKLREMEAEPEWTIKAPDGYPTRKTVLHNATLAEKRKLVQALRRALACISQMAKTGSPRAVNAKTMSDIAQILSAPNDKDGE